ncbi:rhomboid family intramembrane serine protease [Lederbergia sp. NSJ-179]|uniref:rhomboid family intramembrane serine protease n=1 Tax=Lederbergia sp. NSJ-179 TaxID=2931402 RepID=UPI001FD4D912|nr:rhomboid family intramembrane serine protease [Lederbergia sp. NSJ-179]MCJ7843412.1 rhomboid family intramembrane serine protease [Lederbergia sp. NSJ-179]
MTGREHYLFWRLAHFFMVECGYRLIRLNKQQTEMWFENSQYKSARVVRLVKSQMGWSNWLNRDQQHTAAQAERLRKQLFTGNLNVLNLYITEYPPVDADQLTYEEKSGRTKVSTVLMTRGNVKESTENLGVLMGKKVDLQIKDEYKETEVLFLAQAVMNKASQNEKAVQQFFSASKPLFTYIFIAIQIIMFFWLEMNGGSKNPETLIRFGAKFSPLILEGEWWRLITPVFLHIGFIHLFMNTLALYYLGTAVERIFGRIRFVWIYLFSGFMGTLFSFVFTPTLAAGASGAIFGCFGALLYVGFASPQLFFRTIGKNVLILIGINLVFGLIVPGIDYSGHIGGLVGGFLATGLVHFPKKKRWKSQGMFIIILGLFTGFMLYYGYHVIY